MPPSSPAITPAWFRIGSYTYADFSAAVDFFDLVAYTLPIKGVVHGFNLVPTVQFVGGAFMTSYAIQIGIAGDEARWQSPVDLLSVVPGAGVQIMTPPFLDQVSHVVNTPIHIVAISQGEATDQATAGAFYLDALLSVTP